MTSAFSAAQIDRRFLLGITERRYYERGLAYAEEERVALRSMEPLCVSAQVSGSETYSVQLAWRDCALHGRCDCPIGQQEEFCKHQVAVALTWARAVANGGAPLHDGRSKATSAAENSEQRLRHWLATRSPQEMQALMMELADTDRDVRRLLLSRAQLSSAPPQDWRKAVSTLIGRKRFMDHHDSIAYAKRLASLPALLEQARQRDPVAALDLHEYAFKRLVSIYQDCDDSGGHIGQRLHALAQAHPEAAKAAGATNLGKRVFELHMLDEWGLLPPLQEYAALLGSAGIALLERAALQTLHANTADSAKRLAAESLLEDTARCGGSVESMLQWFASRCSSGWDHLEMTRRCAEHGRERQALDWLERGAKAHPTDPRILTELAQAYTRDGFPEDALELSWKAYLLQPEESTYLALRKAALALGQWERWRERALQAADDGSPHSLVDASDTRIHLLLAEGQAHRALDLAKDTTLKLALHTWERLLPEAETLDPPTALRICRTLVEAYVARTNRQNYLIALDVLPTMRGLHQRQDSLAAFDSYLVQLRKTHRAKRSFIELLDKRFPAAK
ncbi:SWIM zinc finger family protein [Xanthomonas theicola]|uniref:SWIM-type domain-containing protein n=1 Tax=Xanthomonas theicola TaxID=56464 RepID=A0A2S6ZEM2_9XANT|nr:hypothetical protein [Xanthomonas theicola]PPT90724.1 hypothetical protein XthCFBP4691_10970 [Xanthomonas theicola]QNH27164.1 hypothetical protein G4Q83_19880 [Xanthomonas theicola]